MGKDHYSISINGRGKLESCKSLEMPITRNSNEFIKDFTLRTSGEITDYRIFDVYVTLYFEEESQGRTYYTNDYRMREALKKQDGSSIY